MKKSTTLGASITLVGCLFIILSFTNGEGLLAEAAVSLLQQQPSSSEENESAADSKTVIITKNPEGVEIGAIKDFVLDLKAGRVAYAVGVFNRPEEFSNRVLVLPWEAVQLDLETNTFILNEDKVALESIPNFALDTWPNLPTPQWAATVAAYWKKQLGRNFAAADTSESVLYKASDVVGMPVRNVAGEEVGTIEELVLDPERGALAYAVLSFEDVESSDRTVFFTLPWNTVQVNPEQPTFTVDVDKEMLAESRDTSPERLESNPSAETLDSRGAQTQRQ